MKLIASINIKPLCIQIWFQTSSYVSRDYIFCNLSPHRQTVLYLSIYGSHFLRFIRLVMIVAFEIFMWKVSFDHNHLKLSYFLWRNSASCSSWFEIKLKYTNTYNSQLQQLQPKLMLQNSRTSLFCILSSFHSSQRVVNLLREDV